MSKEPWDLTEVIRDKYKINKNIPALEPQKMYCFCVISAAEMACLCWTTRNWRMGKWNTGLAYYQANWIGQCPDQGMKVCRKVIEYTHLAAAEDVLSCDHHVEEVQDLLYLEPGLPVGLYTHDMAFWHSRPHLQRWKEIKTIWHL